MPNPNCLACDHISGSAEGPSPGFAELDDLCVQCFIATKLQPAAIAAFEANQKHLDLLLRVNKVEVQLGLRPAPYERDQMVQTRRKSTAAALSKKTGKVTVVQSSGDVVEDELDGLE